MVPSESVLADASNDAVRSPAVELNAATGAALATAVTPWVTVLVPARSSVTVNVTV